MNNSVCLLPIITFFQINDLDIESIKYNKDKIYIEYSWNDKIDVSIHQKNIEKILSIYPHIDWIDFACGNLQIGLKK